MKVGIKYTLGASLAAEESLGLRRKGRPEGSEG